jgi:hypothetical protein
MREPDESPRRARAAARVCVVALAVAVVSACGAVDVKVTAVANQTSPTPAPTPTVSPSPTSSVPVSQLLSVCPKTRSFSSLPVFAQVTGAGYLAVASDGSVWVTNGSHGQVVHLSSTGAPMVTYNETTPEGVVPLPNGDVLIAEQNPDLVVELDPTTLSTTTFLQLTPNPPQPQVSGLGLDAADQLVVVPDTAQSRVLTVPVAGGTPSVLISGIGTPTDAAVGPNDAIEVSQATSNGLLSVPVGGGAVTKYPEVSGLLGVAVKDLLMYVTYPFGHKVVAFNPATGHTYALITGIDQPVGIALLSDGQLLIADASTGTLAIAPSC